MNLYAFMVGEAISFALGYLWCKYYFKP